MLINKIQPMKRFYLFLCLVLPTISALSQQKLHKKALKFVKMETDFEQTPGVVVGLINGDSTIIFATGETAKGNNIAPDLHTIFEIGSCTKVFTASLIAILEKENHLNYEDDVSLYLDKLHFKDKDITILDLLTHYSGLARYPTYFTDNQSDDSNPYETYSYPLLAKYLKNTPSIVRKKRIYTYSHTNYVLLTLIIEKITQRRFEQVLKEKLLIPLGMNDTKIMLTKKDKNRLAQGYDLMDKPAELLKTEVFRGAIALKSTVDDLLKFLNYQLKEGQEPLREVLQSMHGNKMKTPIKKVKSGLAWHHIKPKKRYFSFIAHSGATDGHQVYICFMKETQTAVVLMANSKHDLNGLGSYLLKMMNNNWKRKNP